MSELPRLQPMDGRSVLKRRQHLPEANFRLDRVLTHQSDRLFTGDVRAVLQIAVLPLVLRLQVEPGETTKILLDDSFIDCCSSPDSLSIEVCHRGVVVTLVLNIS